MRRRLEDPMIAAIYARKSKAETDVDEGLGGQG